LGAAQVEPRRVRVEMSKVGVNMAAYDASD
jgi:hypothetical protein